jgi:hypothetical protein
MSSLPKVPDFQATKVGTMGAKLYNRSKRYKRNDEVVGEGSITRLCKNHKLWA